MKINLYVKKHSSELSDITRNGIWMDLRASKDYEIEAFKSQMIELGVSIKLPKFYQANIVPRSGTFKNFKIIQANHYGVIDGENEYSCGYCGNNDIWIFNAIAFEKTTILKNSRICQFEIKPSMDAPFWVKLKFLFVNKINIIYVDDLNGKDRGGFGKSGTF